MRLATGVGPRVLSAAPSAGALLAECGIEVVFGYPSVGCDELLAELADSRSTSLIVAPMEAGAAAAAHAYSSVGGRPCAVAVDAAWAVPELARHVDMAADEGLPILYLLPGGEPAEFRGVLACRAMEQGASRSTYSRPVPLDGPAVWASAATHSALTAARRVAPGAMARGAHAGRLRRAISEGDPVAVLLPPPLAASRAAAEASALRWQVPCLTSTGTDPFPRRHPRLWAGRTGFVPSQEAWATFGPAAGPRPVVADLAGRDRPDWLADRLVPISVDELESLLMTAESLVWQPRPPSDPPPRRAPTPLGQALDSLLGALPQSLVVADAGQSHRVVAELLVNRGYPAVTTAGLTPMGWSVGAALGAAVAQPEATVVVVLGDGAATAAGLHMGSLTVRGHRVVVLLAENGRLGNRSGRAAAGSNRLPPIDWEDVARAVGMRPLRVGPGAIRGADLERVTGLLDGGEAVMVIADVGEPDVVPQSPTGIAAVDRATTP